MGIGIIFVVSVCMLSSKRWLDNIQWRPKIFIFEKIIQIWETMKFIQYTLKIVDTFLKYKTKVLNFEKASQFTETK
jgi:hypothetical protein